MAKEKIVMKYLIAFYIVAMIALWSGALLTFEMVGLLATGVVTLAIFIFGGFIVMIISEFSDIATHPENHNPFKIRAAGMTK